MEYKQFIDGQWCDALNGGTWQVINPATEEVIATVPFGDAREVDRAAQAAHRAFPRWSSLTAYERGDILMRVARLIYERIDDLAPIITRECGKPLTETRAEWTACAQLFEWFAEEGKRAYGRTIPARAAHKRLLVTYMPMGVIGTITAWNFPAYLQARYWAAALAAGCTIVGRPSELTPMSAMALVNSMAEAGIPDGVVNLINGDPTSMGEALVKHPLVEKVCFTGSQRVGRILMSHAADGIKRLSLELGGSAPVLIFDDCDVEQAAQMSVAAKFRNNGQVCVSPARFYAQQGVYEDFMEATKHAMSKLVVGDGLQAGVTNGPMVSAAGRDKVEHFVQDAVAKGAVTVLGGARGAERGYFYQPTLITGLRDDMLIMCDEVFGPVMPVMPFNTLEEGLERANNTPYGLSGYIIGRDLTTITRAYEGLRFGVIGVNDLLPSTPNAPFGGMKQSGFGREMGSEGLYEYLETKFVSIGLS
ncbi:NAD-dependent succinate-semialdehyde dehydrogenase [Aggregatilineales bacterium SYSU G02658]